MSDQQEEFPKAAPATPIDLVELAIKLLQQAPSPKLEYAHALRHLNAALNELEGLMDDE